MKMIKIGMSTEDLNIFDNVILFAIEYFTNFETSSTSKKAL